MNNERNEEIILVNANDEQIGFETKLKAHENGGKLHRAFSIFIFDDTGKMLLQRRSMKKYHFSGLWTNACCSHPKSGEKLQDAAHARLRQEFGFDAELKEIFSFTYRAPDPNSELTEYEFDHVFYGRFNDEPRLADLESNPCEYTPWFKIAVHKVIEKLPIYAAPRPARSNTAREVT